MVGPEIRVLNKDRPRPPLADRERAAPVVGSARRCADDVSASEAIARSADRRRSDFADAPQREQSHCRRARHSHRDFPRLPGRIICEEQNLRASQRHTPETSIDRALQGILSWRAHAAVVAIVILKWEGVDDAHRGRMETITADRLLGALVLGTLALTSPCRGCSRAVVSVRKRRKRNTACAWHAAPLRQLTSWCCADRRPGPIGLLAGTGWTWRSQTLIALPAAGRSPNRASHRPAAMPQPP